MSGVPAGPEGYVVVRSSRFIFEEAKTSDKLFMMAYPGYVKCLENLEDEGSSNYSEYPGIRFLHGFRTCTAYCSDSCALMTCACIPFRFLETVLAPWTDAAACCGCGPGERQPVSRLLNCVVFCPVTALTCGLAAGSKDMCCPNQHCM